MTNKGGGYVGRVGMLATNAGNGFASPVQVQSESMGTHLPNPSGRRGGSSAQSGELGIDRRFSIWIPRNDRGKTFQGEVPGDFSADELPLPGFTDEQKRYIENIDVVWFDKSGISHLFEVEHTTSIYSGLLRFHDLVTMQPRYPFIMYIVAKERRLTTANSQMRRPGIRYLNEIPRKLAFLSMEELAKRYQHLLSSNPPL